MPITKNPLVKILVKLRMLYADIRGHHGKRWDYEPSRNYMGIRKSKLGKKLNKDG
jgi:hypothetical protein